jgi:hypothetical protein
MITNRTATLEDGRVAAVYALEQIGVKYTFGIPGVHNTDYDEPTVCTDHAGAGTMKAAGHLWSKRLVAPLTHRLPATFQPRA